MSDRALEGVLSLGFAFLLTIIGYQLAAGIGAGISGVFSMLVFAQARLLDRNYVVQLPLYVFAATESAPLVFALLVGHWLILPLASGRGMRSTNALMGGEAAAASALIVAASFHPTLGVAAFLVTRLVVSMLIARVFGVPLDTGSISGAPAWIASVAFCLVCLLVQLIEPFKAVTLAQIAIVSTVWLATMRAYLRASIEFSQGLVGLSDLLTYAHPYTGSHSRRVGYLARETGRKVGIPEWRLDEVVQAALLHDIGKLAVDERILEKPTRLTDDEFAVIKTHPAIGESIVAEVLEHKPMAKWIRHHHERMDGRGYPDGLVQKDIPMESRLIAVLDAFDAMTGTSADGHRRLYRDPVSTDRALEELNRCAGTQFDANVVKAFESVLKHGKRGML